MVSELKSETNWLRKGHKTILGFKTSGAVLFFSNMVAGFYAQMGVPRFFETET